MSFSEEIRHLVEQSAVADKENVQHSYGMVIYCDGGCVQVRANEHGPGGAGVHGYLYDYAIPKVISGCPQGYTLTDVGYMESAILPRKAGSEDIEHWSKVNSIIKHPHLKNFSSKDMAGSYLAKRVNPIGYFNMMDHLPKPTTNNRAEMTAMFHGLNEALKVRDLVKRIHIRMDSRYVRDGFVRYIEGWKSSQWKSRDGDVKNVDLWLQMDELRQIILKEMDIFVTLEWVEGHTDYYGNIQADKNATKAKIATGMREPVMSIVGNKDYFKATHEFNKLLQVPRWYYSTGEESDYKDKKIFYVGRHGDAEQDLNFASKMADLMYGVVITDDDPVLAKLRHDFDNRSRRWQEDLIFFTSLNIVFSRETYDELMEHGLKFTNQTGKTIERHDEEVIALHATPVNSAFVGLDFLLTMRRLLISYLEDKLNDKYVLTDITGNIYGYKEGKKGESERYTLPDDSPTLVVNANHRHGDGAVLSHEVILSRGIDIPRRNLFLGIVDDDPKVQLVTWHEGPYTFRYATICTTSKGDAAIWLGAYSNLRILSKTEVKR